MTRDLNLGEVRRIDTQVRDEFLFHMMFCAPFLQILGSISVPLFREHMLFYFRILAVFGSVPAPLRDFLFSDRSSGLSGKAQQIGRAHV